MVNYPKDVGLAARGIACVKIIGRLINNQYSDILRQVSVKRGAQLLRNHLPLKLCICDLPFCVNTCVRPP